jgi:hypothetical protein
MAFIRTNYTRSSSQWNSGVFNTDSYISTTDTLAVITASGYFNEIITELAVNDWIKIVGQDGYEIVVVTSVTTNVTVVDILGALPSHITVAGGTLTSLNGGAIENHTVTGAVAATDLAFTTMKSDGAVPVTILASAIASDDQLTITYSGVPAADHIFYYQIVRPTN